VFGLTEDGYTHEDKRVKYNLCGNLISLKVIELAFDSGESQRTIMSNFSCNVKKHLDMIYM